eukprot:gnl/Spiro4/3895_TR1927_c0_g1_i1.p2 gnl/Spiro4/3895_TR1927_c0_g1~~gnl/Spiro4/3895_TR1927_c0_g1_i1.p2  ORF type:complete len:196 (+),score=50.07 gnl/Spiro4/3895_TR1927_c0_g1_i1:86-589(+)
MTTFRSMSDLKNMSFNEMRTQMHPAHREPMRLGAPAHSDRLLLMDGPAGSGAPLEHLFGLLSLGRFPRSLAHSRATPTSGGMDAAMYENLLSLDDNVRGRGVSAAAQRRIATVTVTTAAPCQICLEDLKAGDRAKKLPCSHMFHDKCISKWFDEHRTCPVCRFEVEK